MGKVKSVIAVYHMSAGAGIEIVDISYSIEGEQISWRWSNEKNVHKSYVKDVKGKACFRANRNWIALDDCLKTRH